MKIVFFKSATTEQIDSVKKRFSSDEFVVKSKENALTVTGINLTDANMNEMRSQFNGVKEVVFQKHWVEEYFLSKKVNLGLDLQGGMHIVLRAKFEKIAEELKKQNKELTETVKNEITQQALELMRNRVDKFGVSEPLIRPRGNEAIEIQLPGIKNPEAVKKALRDTGRLEYRFVDETYTAKAVEWFRENYKEEKLPLDSKNQDDLLKKMKEGIKLPGKFTALYLFHRDKDSKKVYPKSPLVLMMKKALVGTDIEQASVDRDELGRIVVRFKTTPAGAAKLSKATNEKNKGKRLAIILDDKVRSAPSINEQITTGSGHITGGFTFDEASTLARIIKEGALPVPLEIVEERTVGPSLGQDSIESGVKAILIGLAGVILFMLIYYKFAGIIATVGLVLNLVIMTALLSLLGFTLTLPGIAGFILTVGMAVDANVIIYERIKEEIAAGKSVRMSIISGFDKAFYTIVDANLTTLIAMFILSQFGTGPIKGFANTLMIGIISSMFVALYITRFIYELISLNKKIKRLSI
ncbi:protein translocase subunit SecD [Spirochaetota bacterium]